MDLLSISADLYQHGWSRQDGFLDASQAASLLDYARRLQADGRLQPARIGHGGGRGHHPDIRGDAIAWADEPVPELLELNQALESLRQTLNRELMLGLFEFEGHFAAYPPGAFYRKHLDQFRDSDLRRISCILYLNPPDWRPDDGGELRLFLDGEREEPFVDLAPTGGTLVTFLSERFHHEVRPTRRERFSFTGWFRVRA